MRKDGCFSADGVAGAMTNFIFLVNKNEGENAKVLVRIYGEGTENFFKREDEMKLFKLLSDANVGIGLLGTFENGRVERVINGEVGGALGPLASKIWPLGCGV